VNPGSGQTERDAAPNKPSLRGFEVIDAFIARDSISLTGSISYQVPAGRALCPVNKTRETPITTAMDPGTPNVLDNNYYKLLPRGMGLFFSDNQLRVDHSTTEEV